MIYACQHCGWTQPMVEGEPEPACPDHPDTPVKLVNPSANGEVADGDN